MRRLAGSRSALVVPCIQRRRPFRAAAIPASKPLDAFHGLMDADGFKRLLDPVTEQLTARCPGLIAVHQ